MWNWLCLPCKYTAMTTKYRIEATDFTTPGTISCSLNAFAILRQMSRTRWGGKYCFDITENNSDPWLLKYLWDPRCPWSSTELLSYLCSLCCQSWNGYSQSKFSCCFTTFTSLLVISRTIVSYALTDRRISGQKPLKRWFSSPLKKMKLPWILLLDSLESRTADLYVICLWFVLLGGTRVSGAGSVVMALWGQGGLREGPESDYFMFSTHTVFLQQNFKLFII